MNKYWRIILRSTDCTPLRSAWMDEERARKQAAITALLWHGSTWVERDDSDEHDNSNYEERIV